MVIRGASSISELPPFVKAARYPPSTGWFAWISKCGSLAASAYRNEAAAVQFAMDAFGHLKAIGASEAAKPLLDKAGVQADEGVTDLGAAFVAAAGKRFYAREPGLRTLA